MRKDAAVVYEGQLDAKGLKIGIVCARFNEFFVSKLLGGALDCIVRHSGKAESVSVVWVPGSQEIPLAVKKLLTGGKFDAVIGLGVVIQGATAHAGLISTDVNKAISQLSLEFDTPVINGVVSVGNIEQAIERSGTKAGNKGYDAACTAIEMANLLKGM